MDHADLSGADLSKAKLRGAELAKVNLSRADFTGASIEGVRWWKAFYIKGQPPIGLPQGIMEQLTVKEKDDD